MMPRWTHLAVMALASALVCSQAPPCAEPVQADQADATNPAPAPAAPADTPGAAPTGDTGDTGGAQPQAADDDVTPADDAPPPNPFGGSQVGKRPDALSGVVELSDGTRVPGDIYGTRGQGLLVLDLDRKKDKWRRVPLAAVIAVETRVDWQRMDPEWRFRTAGDTEKVYTGKTYPNRRYSYLVTLRDKSQIRCRIKGVPVYVRPTGGKPRLFVLHERHKGPVGTKLKDLVYVTSVRFGDELRRQVEDELRRKAEEEAARKAARETGEQDNPRPENAGGNSQGGDGTGADVNVKDNQ